MSEEFLEEIDRCSVGYYGMESKIQLGFFVKNEEITEGVWLNLDTIHGIQKSE